MKVDFHSKKVLIFGIDSFTGIHLELYLKRYDYLVFGTSFNPSDKQNIFQCNIKNQKDIQKIIGNLKPHYIINLAGISFVGNKNRELFYQVNVLGVENILESILKIKNYIPKKTILVSSATVYGNQERNILDESMTPNPINHYGISKLAMEQVVKTYFDKMGIIITRPFNYTGIGQSDHFLIPKIISHYKENKKSIELGNIDVFREFNDIQYICETYKRILESDAKSEIINIASNRLIALKDIIKEMDKISKYNIQIEVNPKFVRNNEIVLLSGSTDKLFNICGKIEQKELEKTLKEMYYD